MTSNNPNNLSVDEVALYVVSQPGYDSYRPDDRLALLSKLSGGVALRGGFGGLLAAMREPDAWQPTLPELGDE